MKTNKVRKDSGRKYTKIFHPKEFPFEELKFDNWENYRDGLRDSIPGDQTLIHNCKCQYCVDENKANNSKIKHKLSIRSAMKSNSV